MPTYFTDLRADVGSNAVTHRDDEGSDHPHLDDATHEAISSAKEMMADDLRSGWPLNDGRSFVIRGDTGPDLSVVLFTDAAHAMVGR